MRERDHRQAAVAFWTLLGAVVVTTLASVLGNLAPALLSRDAGEVCGDVAFGLVALAHALPLAGGLVRAACAPARLGLVSSEA